MKGHGEEDDTEPKDSVERGSGNGGGKETSHTSPSTSGCGHSLGHGLQHGQQMSQQESQSWQGPEPEFALHYTRAGPQPPERLSGLSKPLLMNTLLPPRVGDMVEGPRGPCLGPARAEPRV